MNLANMLSWIRSLGKKEKLAVPRPYSLVKFKRKKYSEEHISRYYHDIVDKTLIFLGEIPNQPGHCILWSIEQYPGIGRLDYEVKPELFRHTADFEELSEDEV